MTRLRNQGPGSTDVVDQLWNEVRSLNAQAAEARQAGDHDTADDLTAAADKKAAMARDLSRRSRAPLRSRGRNPRVGTKA